MRDDPLRLQDMIDSIARIHSFCAGRTRSELDTDDAFKSAVLYKFSILGEAAYTISRKLKAKHPEIEWRTISGMRHWIIHSYFEVNLNTVWETIQNDISPLSGTLQKVLETEFGQK